MRVEEKQALQEKIQARMEELEEDIGQLSEGACKVLRTENDQVDPQAAKVRSELMDAYRSLKQAAIYLND